MGDFGRRVEKKELSTAIRKNHWEMGQGTYSKEDIFSKDTKELPISKHIVCPVWVKITSFWGILGPATQ